MVVGRDDQRDVFLIAGVDDVQRCLVVALSFAAVFVQDQQVLAADFVQVRLPPFPVQGAQAGVDLQQAGVHTVVACVCQGVDDLRHGVGLARAGAAEKHQPHTLCFHFFEVGYIVLTDIRQDGVIPVVMGKVTVAQAVCPQSHAAVFPFH